MNKLTKQQKIVLNKFNKLGYWIVMNDENEECKFNNDKLMQELREYIELFDVLFPKK